MIILILIAIVCGIISWMLIGKMILERSKCFEKCLETLTMDEVLEILKQREDKAFLDDLMELLFWPHTLRWYNDRTKHGKSNKDKRF